MKRYTVAKVIKKGIAYRWGIIYGPPYGHHAVALFRLRSWADRVCKLLNRGQR